MRPLDLSNGTSISYQSGPGVGDKDRQGIQDYLLQQKGMQTDATNTVINTAFQSFKK